MTGNNVAAFSQTMVQAKIKIKRVDQEIGSSCNNRIKKGRGDLNKKPTRSTKSTILKLKMQTQRQSNF